MHQVINVDLGGHLYFCVFGRVSLISVSRSCQGYNAKMRKANRTLFRLTLSVLSACLIGSMQNIVMLIDYTTPELGGKGSFIDTLNDMLSFLAMICIFNIAFNLLRCWLITVMNFERVSDNQGGINYIRRVDFCITASNFSAMSIIFVCGFVMQRRVLTVVLIMPISLTIGFLTF